MGKGWHAESCKPCRGTGMVRERRRVKVGDRWENRTVDVGCTDCGGAGSIEVQN